MLMPMLPSGVHASASAALAPTIPAGACGLEERLLFVGEDLREVHARIEDTTKMWVEPASAASASDLVTDLMTTHEQILELAARLRRICRDLQAPA